MTIQIILKKEFGLKHIEHTWVASPPLRAWPRSFPMEPVFAFLITKLPVYFMYNQIVCNKSRTLVPSGGGALELADVKNIYISEGNMAYAHVDGWTDPGTCDSLLRAGNLVAGSREQ